jgi:RNA polymerase sigma-70 factor (ECF subfamily)
MVVQHESILHPYALSLTNNYEDARDLYQETMLRALLNQDKYRFGTNLKAWLYTIMRNIFINNYRRSKKFVKAPEEGIEIALNDHTKVANEGWSNLRLNEIKNAMERLPQLFRLSFELYYIGYKYQEIAELTREPLGTIKSRIHFARKMLIKQLDR